MRFSVKWLLSAAVYVAVAAAALSQQSGLYGDALWGLTLLALLFAALLAIFMRGEGRIIATGFLLAGGAYLIYATIVPTYSSASARVLRAVGYDPAGVAFPAAPTTPSTPLPADNPFENDPFADNPLPADRYGPPAPQQPPAHVVDLAQFVRAGNAIGVVLMGLLGALVGGFAARVIAAHNVARS